MLVKISHSLTRMFSVTLPINAKRHSFLPSAVLNQNLLGTLGAHRYRLAVFAVIQLTVSKLWNELKALTLNRENHPSFIYNIYLIKPGRT